MTIFDAAILGIVEGITEFLPISSTGHLILVSEILHLPQTEFLKTFEVAIQLGAILSVVVLYFRSLLDIEVLKRLFVAFIPTGLVGLALYGFAKTYLLGNQSVVLAALAIGGVVLIAFEWFHTKDEGAPRDIRSITYREAASLGLFQAIAIVPGVSRSAATIVGGLLMGIHRTTIVEFSFLLAVPTMLAATGLDVVRNFQIFTSANIGLLAVGFIVSFAVALIAIRWLLGYIRSHTFTAFGVYRILAAALFFLFIVR